MKRSIYLLFTVFFLALFTFSYWYVVQDNINRQLRTIEQKLESFHQNP